VVPAAPHTLQPGLTNRLDGRGEEDSFNIL
jgi:hypothetical protein